MSLSETIVEPNCCNKGALMDSLETSDLIAGKQLQEELLSAAIHDLRSPLSAISIFCELINGDPEADEGQKQNLAMIAEAATKMQAIMEDATEFSAIYRNALTVRALPVNVTELIDSVLKRMSSSDNGKHLDLQVHGLDSQAYAMADAARLQQILIRVLEEAAACARDSRKLEISCENPDERLLLTISAPGSACDEVRFREQGFTNVKNRLGLRGPFESRYSLLLCERIMRLMNGTMEFEIIPHFSCKLSLPVSRA